ncbi:MAG: response regulator, partial [Nitrospirales bacterium]
MAYLAKETPDLVVSDVIMPDKSGYEVCAFVRGQKAIANTPVLLISGIVNDEVTKQAESCHADGVLKKPFQGTSLKDRVIELLAKRQGAAAPAAKSIEKGTESNQPIQNARVSDEQLATYQRATARLKALEEELLVERDRATRSAQRVVQLEGELGHAQELEPMLAKEREQITQLKMQLAETERSVAQVRELESALKTERDRTAEAKNQASLAKSLGERVRELEMALQKERDDRAQQATGFAELQKQASRVQELEATLQAERQAAAQLVEQMTEMEQGATRSQILTQQVSTLEQSLAAEQQRSKDLAVRLSEAEHVTKTTSE